MSVQCETVARKAGVAELGFFERYLTLWVAACIVAGIAVGRLAPGLVETVAALEVARLNLPVGVLIWVMIIPMLMKVDYARLHEARRHARGVGVTLFVNWAVKPFSMALLALVFVRGLFAEWLPPEQLDSFTTAAGWHSRGLARGSSGHALTLLKKRHADGPACGAEASIVDPLNEGAFQLRRKTTGGSSAAMPQSTARSTTRSLLAFAVGP